MITRVPAMYTFPSKAAHKLKAISQRFEAPSFFTKVEVWADRAVASATAKARRKNDRMGVRFLNDGQWISKSGNKVTGLPAAMSTQIGFAASETMLVLPPQ